MRILQVIHGYPPAYNAGSEVYTRALSHGLARAGHSVAVFTREEDPFRPDYALRDDADRVGGAGAIPLRLLNMPRSRDRYRHPPVDRAFGSLVEEVRPDVVHVGHLNHLSTGLVLEASRRGVPVVMTLHDYWLMCPRGQFVQHALGDEEVWRPCEAQEDRKCALQCYSRYFADGSAEDVDYWARWVERRMAHVRDVAAHVDAFIAPSRYLAARFVEGFGLPPDRVACLDYGFDLARLAPPARRPEGAPVFGYIGTHTAPKGIHLLIEAFGRLRGEARMRVWGRPQAQVTPALRALVDRLPAHRRDAVEWMGEYRNEDIARDVFARVDAVVVPSIWAENSPLVIHEAQQCRVPVITADFGGMREFVRQDENGLLFAFRDAGSLAEQMQRLVDEPGLAARLGRRGYLHSADGDVVSMEAHVREVERVYEAVVARRAVPA
jgi:glycosyltransferase involved in cell wall biosynthesis